MFALPERLSLTVCDTGLSVVTRIVALTRDLAKTKIDPVWWAGLTASNDAKAEEPDRHWNWTKHLGDLRQELQKGYTECRAVQTDDGDVQAAIIYRIDGLSLIETNDASQKLGAVRCAFLATAPRNRTRLNSSPIYRGAGTGLLNLAMAHSYSLGLGGRVNLESSRFAQTETFYKKFGFELVATDADGYSQYEVRSEVAVSRLRELGWLDGA